MIDSRCEGCAAIYKCQHYVGYGSVVCALNKLQTNHTKAELANLPECKLHYDKAIQDFFDKAFNFEDYIKPYAEQNGVQLYSGKDITKMILAIRDELRG